MVDNKVKPESYGEVYLPIAPQVEQGTITIKIMLAINNLRLLNRQDFSIDLEITLLTNPTCFWYLQPSKTWNLEKVFETATNQPPKTQSKTST